MKSKCSKCGLVGREHAKFFCPPPRGHKNAKRHSSAPVATEIATETPKRGETVAGVGGSKAGSHRQKRKSTTEIGSQ